MKRLLSLMLIANIATACNASTFTDTTDSIKKVAAQVVTATKNGAFAIRDATVNATNTVVDATKRAGSAVKNTAVDIAKSDAADDVKELGLEFAEVPGQVWEGITDLGKSTKNLFQKINPFA